MASPSATRQSPAGRCDAAQGASLGRAMTQHSGTMRSVLIVDADPKVVAALAEILRPQGYATQSAETSEQALAALRDADDPAPVALIDVRLGGTATGIDLIPRLRAEQPELICVLMTAE